MALLSIQNLCKHYERFDLKDVSFSVSPGKIVGFIGRNGAGKTTTLKCIYNLVKPTSGQILYDGKPTVADEPHFKSEVGLLFGEVNFYPSKTVKALTSVTKMFYPLWDENLYQGYLREFGIDETKQIKALSTGMRVKYGLAVALSHGAKILILDEPTSGLDPVSRDELLDTFLNLVGDGQHSILFSTHVISDLEKCADEIVYIQNGAILANEDVTSFEAGYLHYSGPSEAFASRHGDFIYEWDRLGKFEGVAKKNNAPLIDFEGVECRKASMEEIMVALERGQRE